VQDVLWARSPAASTGPAAAAAAARCRRRDRALLTSASSCCCCCCWVRARATSTPSGRRGSRTWVHCMQWPAAAATQAARRRARGLISHHPALSPATAPSESPCPSLYPETRALCRRDSHGTAAITAQDPAHTQQGQGQGLCAAMPAGAGRGGASRWLHSPPPEGAGRAPPPWQRERTDRSSPARMMDLTCHRGGALASVSWSQCQLEPVSVGAGVSWSE
jgi:hypothetical protein